MKKISLALAMLVLGMVAAGCTTYQERTIDQGTVVEQHTVVE